MGARTYYNAVVTVASVVSIGGMTGSDTYNLSTHVLTIPTIQLGNTVYTDVNVTVFPGTIKVNGGMPNAVADSVVPSTGTLSIPAVQFLGSVYTNVTVNVDLTSATAGSDYAFLHSFAGGKTDGSLPYGSLVMDGAGNLYGTTNSSGSASAGTVFMVTPAGTETVLHSFAGGIDGRGPQAGLVMDSAGNLYGTTTGGGRGSAGTVFKVTSSGTESVLYYFSNQLDGGDPSGGLLIDSSGNLYGTTVTGGAHGNGTVFQVSPTGMGSVIHSFAGGSTDGVFPSATLIMDGAGNLYGTTEGGGPGGAGTVFKITPSGSESIVYGFTGGTDGGNPMFGGVVMDSAGNLYGTTLGGGAAGHGTVFKIAPSGSESVLYSFTGGADGDAPTWGVILDNAGNLYGTAYQGGDSGNGAVFKVTPSGNESVLHSFAGSSEGQNPNGGLIMDGKGHLYGMTESGGTGGGGTVFRVD